MNPWSQAEVDAIVADYFAMLRKELKGKPYSKTAHRNRLIEKLTHRNSGAVQKKYQTLSAVLLALGLPHIKGYKPLDNYQTMLIESIDTHLEKHPEIVGELTDFATRPLSIPMQRGLFPKATIVEAPKLPRPESANKRRLIRRIMKKFTFVTAEAFNPDLKEAGEGFVLDLERARLREKGASRMVDRVRPISGKAELSRPYDILSFEADGRPRHIKVKTTSGDLRFPFPVSTAELAFSASNPDTYFLFRLFHFPETPRLFILEGRLHDWVRLTPESFLARFD